MPTSGPGPRVLLGVGGGIAAYKTAELVRRLQNRGADVRVVMTDAATRFIGPMTLQALSGHPVRTTLWDPAAEAAMGHIELARWAERVLVAPASAGLIARLAHGHADDLLTTLCLATEAPLALAPAMNRVMWSHPATQANVALLRARGVALHGPAEGDQACGETGPGRMLEAVELAERLLGAAEQSLAGRRVLVTAGPTFEDIDPVRYIGNRSSGRMGFALAAAARALGADVVLVAGPCAQPTPAGVRRVDVRSAADMHAAVLEELDGIDVFIGAAAVADYRPERQAPGKIKKTEGSTTLALTLTRTPDIIAAVAARSPRPLVVGFAAETEALEDNARHKLERKGLDLIAANPVGGSDSAFDAADSQLTVLWRGGRRVLGRADKRTLAFALLELVAERLRETGDA